MLPQIRDSIRVPIIAAGGIADARGMQAAFALGAQGIQMGTRFLASCECEVSQEFKNKILGARDTDSTVIGRKTGRPTRVIRNKFSKEYTELEDKGSNKGSLSDFMRGTLRLAVESDQDNGAIHSGEIAGLIKEVKPAKEIIEDIVLQFKHYDEDRLVPDSNLEIYTYLKHRPPMLLVDSILSRVPKISCTTLLNTNLHRLFFKGHYPDYPILPGTVLLEAMSQAMVISFSDASVNELPKAGFLLREIVNAKFFKEVTPGMILIVNSRTLSYRRGIYHSTISCEQQGREGVVACSEQKIVIPTELISPKTVSKA
jgi:3-hydroxymyristoyl/3-hydroxydecanoyl-(acyl carrier protein) dehydratase